MSVISLVKTPPGDPTLKDFAAVYETLDKYAQREVFELAERLADEARDEIRAQRWSWDRDRLIGH